MTANQQAAISAWSEALGAEFVLHSEAAQIAYGSDTGDAKRRIVAALLISDAAQLKTVLKISQQHRLAVYPISTGHNWGYGTALPPRDDCVIIDLSRLQSIIDFDAELGVVTLEPGVTQGMLAEYLAKGQHDFLVPVTGAGPSCSLMANALERGYGVTPYVDHFGAVTDIEGVLPDGSPYRTALREAGALLKDLQGAFDKMDAALSPSMRRFLNLMPKAISAKSPQAKKQTEQTHAITIRLIEAIMDAIQKSICTATWILPATTH